MQVYNPWSTMYCLKKQVVFDNYWVDSGGIGMIEETLLSDALQPKLKALKKLRQLFDFYLLEWL